MDVETAKLQTRKYSLQAKRYFLFVGNLKPHKNLNLLFKSYALLTARHHEAPDLVLVSNMDKQWMPALLELARKLKIESKIHWIKDVDDLNLRALYVAAEALVLPSTEEGFDYLSLKLWLVGPPSFVRIVRHFPKSLG